MRFTRSAIDASSAQLAFDDFYEPLDAPRTSSEPPPQRRGERFVVKSPTPSTGISGDQTPETATDVSPSAERVYPHLYDREPGSAGIVMTLIVQAASDSEAAVDAFSSADFEELSTRLGIVAAAMAAAHPYTSFNECLGAILSYIRRATLRAEVTSVTLEQLMGLGKILQTLPNMPMIDLDAASGLVDELAAQGWDGEHREVNEFVAQLFQDDAATSDARLTVVAPELAGKGR